MTKSNNSLVKLISRIFLTSIGTVFEVMALALIFDLSIPLVFIGIIATVIGLIYGWDFFREYARSANKTNRRFFIALLISILLCFLLLIKSLDNQSVATASILLLIIGLLYDPFFKKFSTKIIGFKDLFVICCFETLVILFLAYNQVSPLQIIIITAFAATRDFVNITYCDIKDISPDKEKGLQTIASTLGISKLINLHYVLSGFSIMILLLGVYFETIPFLCAFLVIPTLITTILIYLSTRSRRYSPSNVDAEYIGWLIFVYLGKMILWL